MQSCLSINFSSVQKRDVPPKSCPELVSNPTCDSSVDILRQLAGRVDHVFITRSLVNRPYWFRFFGENVGDIIAPSFLPVILILKIVQLASHIQDFVIFQRGPNTILSIEAS